MSSSYQVFARKYRPRVFADILGQDHVVKTLENAIAKNRLAHAYLFVGPRGTGKTTTARILAKALNCPGGPKVDFDPDDPVCREIAEGISLDVLEIDGASNNSVEEIRKLRETVAFAPASGKFRIYYIDEVHMLSTAAFNALLKTLEEPPKHVKFIFATTEPQKILPTIISRCQRFDLRRIPANIIAEQLLFIAKNESVQLSESAAHAIAKGADGGMRDAESMLDQMVAFCGSEIEETDVLSIFGFSSAESIAQLADAIVTGNNATALEMIHNQGETGKDLGRFLADLIGYFRNVLVSRVNPGATNPDISPEVRGFISRHAASVDTGRLLHLIDQLAEADGSIKWSSNKKLHLEIAALKAIQSLQEASLDEVIALVSEAASSAGGLSPSGVPGEARQPVSRSASPSRVAEPVAKPPIAAKPADEPMTEPTAIQVPLSPSGDPGPVFWQEARRKLIAEHPLFAMWMEATHFLGHEGGEVRIGFATDQRLYRESLMRHEALINEALSESLGTKARVVMEVRADLQPIQIEDEEVAPPSAPIPPQAVPPLQVLPNDKTAADSSENFYNDPLVNQAVEIFDAKIKK